MVLSLSPELCSHRHGFRTFSSFPKETPSHCQSLPWLPAFPALGSHHSSALSSWICLFWEFHTHALAYRVAFWDWLSLRVMFSGVIHVVAGAGISFSLPSSPLVWMHCILFVHWSLAGHLGCVRSLAIVSNNVALIIRVQLFCVDLDFHFSWIDNTGAKLLGHTVTIWLIFWGSATLFS